MGIDIYHLDPDARRQVAIGHTVFEVGLITRLWKVTETSLLDSRLDTIENLEDVQASRQAITPPVVLVDGHYSFGEHREISAFRLLGWDDGRVKTQDYGWDHLPTVGWAVTGADGMLVVHEEVDGNLLPMLEDRAQALGILTLGGGLAEHRLPIIAECLSVDRVYQSTFAAECRFADGREGRVLGESESGDLPSVEWFVGRDTAEAARYGLVDQLAGKR
jgi:hypothetical protein